MSVASEPLEVESGGRLLLWILVWSELAVFGVLLVAFSGLALLAPSALAALQRGFDLSIVASATVVLVTSGFFAARAASGRSPRANLIVAAIGGFAFCTLKIIAYARELRVPGVDENRLFEPYLLITGFHLAHVAFLGLLLLIVALRRRSREIETITTLWHVVDLVWLLILPIIYLG